MVAMTEVRLAYPASSERDSAGRILVRFPDFPEALTDGATEEEAFREAADALSEALMSRIVDREEIPRPRPVTRGLRLIVPDPIVALKVALYWASNDRHVSAGKLAKLLDVDPKEARRLLDPVHRSKAPMLVEALNAIGIEAAFTFVDKSENRRILSAPTERRRAHRMEVGKALKLRRSKT